MQDINTFRGMLDSISYPKTLRIVPDFVQTSPLLSLLIGRNVKAGTDANGNKKFSLAKTYSGFQKRIGINEAELYKTQDELNDLAIDYGDEKVSKVDRKLIYGDIYPSNIGFSLEMTEADRQKIQARPDEWADWITDSFNQAGKYLSIFFLNQLLNGTADTNGERGVITKTDGSIRDGLVGLNTILSATAKYAGHDTSDYRYWKGHNWDMGSSLFNYAATDMDTVTELLSVPTDHVIPRFYDILSKAVSVLNTWNKAPGSKMVIVMNAVVYDYLFKPTVQIMKIPGVQLKTGLGLLSGYDKKGMNLDMIPDEGYYVGNALVIREDAMMADKYIMPTQYIYFLNLNDLVFEAQKSKNFTVSGWKPIVTKYSAFVNSIEATVRFYAKSRYSMGRLKLPSAVVTELTGITGVDFTTD